MGLKLTVGANKTGSFGTTTVQESVIFRFTPQFPLIGLYGYNGPNFISGMSVITYDLSDECQYFKPAEVLEADQKEFEESKSKPVAASVDTAKEGVLDVETMAIYTGAAFALILVILAIVMVMEKIRRKYKRLTTIIRLKSDEEKQTGTPKER